MSGQKKEGNAWTQNINVMSGQNIGRSCLEKSTVWKQNISVKPGYEFGNHGWTQKGRSSLKAKWEYHCIQNRNECQVVNQGDTTFLAASGHHFPIMFALRALLTKIAPKRRFHNLGLKRNFKT